MYQLRDIAVWPTFDEAHIRIGVLPPAVAFWVKGAARRRPGCALTLYQYLMPRTGHLGETP